MLTLEGGELMTILYFEGRLAEIQDETSRLERARAKGLSGPALDDLAKVLARDVAVYQNIVDRFYQQ